MNSPLKVGILGCGLMGGIHARSFAAARSAKVVGYYNPTRTKAEALAQELGGEVYDSVEALLCDSGCNAVVIAGPQQVHAEQFIAAARAGKHIFCEKPLALTPSELDAMQQAARSAGVTVMVAYQMRFHPVVKWVHENQKRLGRIFYFELEWPFLIRGHQGRCWEDFRSGGFFMELGCHAVDLARYLQGEVRHLNALTTRLDSRRITEDFTHCQLQFENGTIGSILVSANHRRKRQGMLNGRILGEKGCLEFTVYPYSRTCNQARLCFDGGQNTFVPDTVNEKMGVPLPPSLNPVYAGFFDSYQQCALAFIKATRNGKIPPVTFDDGRRAVELVLGAYAAQGAVSERPNHGALSYRVDGACHPALRRKAKKNGEQKTG